MAPIPDRCRVPARKPSGWPALAAAALAAVVTLSHAQQAGWQPGRPVEMIVPTAPGGAIDRTTRVMQKIMQDGKMVPVPLVVMNKPGGGQTLAMNYLDQHAGDGHYMLTSTMSLMTNHVLGRSKVNYTDYTPLAVLYGEPMTIVVRPDSPLKSGRDIQEKLKGDPSALSMGIGIAVGGTNHLSVALVMNAMGIDVKKLKTVVFQANAEALTAVMGGHVDLSPMSAATALRAAEQGKLRVIGIASERRGEGAMAEIPTWKEQGFDVVFTNIRFMLGPRGMSPAQTAYWDGAFKRLVESAEWKKELERNHWEPEYVDSRQAPARLAALYQQLKGALVDVGLAKN